MRLPFLVGAVVEFCWASAGLMCGLYYGACFCFGLAAALVLAACFLPSEAK